MIEQLITPRRFYHWIATLLGVLLLAAPIARAQELKEPQPGWWAMEVGRQQLEEKCAGCHSIGTVGPSPHAQAPPFRILSQRYRVSDLEEALAEGIMTGHPDMPLFEFDAQSVRGIIVYLESIQPQR